MFSCSKSEQKQLNTWVSFESAEQPLLGQFSVSGNNSGASLAQSTPVQPGHIQPHSLMPQTRFFFGSNAPLSFSGVMPGYLL
ncbi:hypothetical protein C1751_01780 [Pseudomonas fluorescens]|nr:hypothetical protein C1751_01780 [Pseudomonas fluorescens]